MGPTRTLLLEVGPSRLGSPLGAPRVLKPEGTPEAAAPAPEARGDGLPTSASAAGVTPTANRSPFPSVG